MSFSLSKESLSELGIIQKRRKGITKKIREQVKNKTNGKCGYCGVELPNRWHVDHIEPFEKQSSRCEIDNFMASCPQCNNFKNTHSVEQFRKELRFQVDRARNYSVNFRFAEKYGLITITEKPIVFYFETLEEYKHRHGSDKK